MKIREKTLGKEHPRFIESINTLSELYINLGKFDKAWEYVFQVIQMTSELNLALNINASWSDSLLHAKYQSNFHLKTMVSSLNKIYTLLKNDTTIVFADKKQIIVADLAIALSARFKNSVSSDKDKLRILALGNIWLQRSLSILNQKDDCTKAFNLMDQNKSVLLLQATKSEESYHLGELPDSLIWKDKKNAQKTKSASS